MNFNNPKFADDFIKIIRNEIKKALPTQERLSGTVTDIGGGVVTVNLSTDPITNTIDVQNPREIPCEVGDQVWITAINGNLSNAIVEFRKGITLDKIYVDYNTGTDAYADEKGRPCGTSDKPFKTPQYAINRLPKDLNGRTVAIYIINSNSSEEIMVKNFFGGGSLLLTSNTSSSETIKSITVESCKSRIVMQRINCTSNTVQPAIQINRSLDTDIYDCTCSGETGFEGTGIEVTSSNVEIRSCTLTNNEYGIMAQSCSTIFSYNNSGSNIFYGLLATNASTIGKSGTQPTGGTLNEYATDGAEIR